MATSDRSQEAALARLSDHAVRSRRSAIRVLFDAAAGQDDVVRLEIGEPSFKTPTHIIEGAAQAARDGYTGYTPNGGYMSLREMLADKIQRVDGYEVAAEQVVATPGAMNALFSIYFALLNPGDEVLLPTPGFPNMDEMVRVVGGEPRFYALRADNGFLPDLDELKAAVSPRTKAIFINTPGNPTGAVFPRHVMEDLVEFAERNNIWLISDEVYDQLLLDDDVEHYSAARVSPDRVISVYSFSKIFAMTGWRLGYCAAPAPVAEILRKLQEPICSCPSALSQKAAEAALKGPWEPIEEMRQAYIERRDVAWQAAVEQGLSVMRTRGTFYMLLGLGEPGDDSLAMALDMLREARVTVAPGMVFGPGGDGLARISFAVEPDVIREGMRRIGDYARAHGAVPVNVS